MNIGAARDDLSEAASNLGGFGRSIPRLAAAGKLNLAAHPMRAMRNCTASVQCGATLMSPQLRLLLLNALICCVT